VWPCNEIPRHSSVADIIVDNTKKLEACSTTTMTQSLNRLSITHGNSMSSTLATVAWLEAAAGGVISDIRLLQRRSRVAYLHTISMELGIELQALQARVKAVSARGGSTGPTPPTVLEDVEYTTLALVLSDEKLTQVPLFVFAAAALQMLDLSRNKLKDLPPAIGGLAALTELNISRNFLKREFIITILPNGDSTAPHGLTAHLGETDPIQCLLLTALPPRLDLLVVAHVDVIVAPQQSGGGTGT
jgi:Leucine-rich repeat (LRR) protein